jgi:VIT1/CCC1 family predicted Fe2+/Mn2+ transporter
MGGNALRAAVLGANDGLVSNLSLIMGVAGAAFSADTILITGFAGLLAGACSMAMGEWLSVQSSRELYMRQIEVEKEELELAPHEEQEELALIYEAKGVPKEEAQRLAAAIAKDPAKALDALTREELGIDPESLGGSAWAAAFFSFILFCVGAFIPLIPFLFWQGPYAIMASLIFSSAGLFLIGGMITLFTGRSLTFSGMRQLAIGLGAAAITYGLGRMVGIAITG